MENIKKIQDLENKLWKAANQLRGNLSSEEYMHVVVAIVFLKQTSYLYEKAILEMKKEYPSDWEKKSKDVDYLNHFGCSFIVPKEASWNYISDYATKEEIGIIIDDAFRALENNNKMLLGLFDKNFSRDAIDKVKLGKVVSIFSNINISDQEEDLLGRVYEYFLGKFFLDRGQSAGAFYTPKSIVSLMVNIVDPRKGKIYDPCCGSGGMFIQAKQHLEDLNLGINDFKVYGQEYNEITWKLGKINLLLQGFKYTDIDLGKQSADTLANDLHKNVEFDYILVNPPFNQKDWSESARENRSWKYGTPPITSANYAWLQHVIEKMAQKGKAAVVLARGSLTSQQLKEEKNIRENLIKDNIITAIIDLPDKLFYTTQIPACIWIFDKAKTTNDILFIDASSFGKLIPGERAKKEILNEDIEFLTKIYMDFIEKQEKIDIPEIAKSIGINEIIKNDYSLLPGTYITIKEEILTKDKIKNELVQNIKDFLNLVDESNELESKVKEAIKKINMDI